MATTTRDELLRFGHITPQVIFSWLYMLRYGSLKQCVHLSIDGFSAP